MAVYFIYGRLGSGKTLVATARAFEAYGVRGVPLALNYPVYVEHSPYPYAKAPIYRLPDYPTSDDLKLLPAIKADGSTTAETIGELESWHPDRLKDHLGGYDESKQGILILDEASHYLGSREWSHTDRHKVVTWLTQARKYGWSIYLLVQAIGMIDKQVREALGEHGVECKRLDRVAIPFLTRLSRNLIGIEIRPPRVHVGIVRYGLGGQATIVDRWFIRGSYVFRLYDTRYVFRQDCGWAGLYHMLSPFQYYGRRFTPMLHFARVICQNIIDWHKAWIAPMRAYVLIAVSLTFGWAAGVKGWIDFSDPVAPVEAVQVQTKKIVDPWEGVELVMEWGSERVYQKNGVTIDVKHRINAGKHLYCIENSCRSN